MFSHPFAISSAIHKRNICVQSAAKEDFFQGADYRIGHAGGAEQLVAETGRGIEGAQSPECTHSLLTNRLHRMLFGNVRHLRMQEHVKHVLFD